MEQFIDIRPLTIRWSDWHRFRALKMDVWKTGLYLPEATGVYQAKMPNGEILTIGRATNLRHRIKQGLIKCKIPHSAGKRIMASFCPEDHDQLLVRWAETIIPCAVEEFLHQTYTLENGALPRFTKRT